MYVYVFQCICVCMMYVFQCISVCICMYCMYRVCMQRLTNLAAKNTYNMHNIFTICTRYALNMKTHTYNTYTYIRYGLIYVYVCVCICKCIHTHISLIHTKYRDIRAKFCMYLHVWHVSACICLYLHV